MGEEWGDGAPGRGPDHDAASGGDPARERAGQSGAAADRDDAPAVGPRADRGDAPQGDGPQASPSDWRAAVLADFGRWLAHLDPDGDADARATGDDARATGDGAPAATDALDGETGDGLETGCDLHTLLSQMAALRQEVRLQTREQARALRHVEGEREALGAAVAALEREREAGRQEQAGARALLEDAGRQAYRAGVRDVLAPLLEVRDALERGRSAAARSTGRHRWLRPAGLAEVTAGYDMALARFDRTLAAFGVTPVAGVGADFDPRTMVAAAARHEAGVADGVVVEVLRTGFVEEGQRVLRPADVIVNRSAGDPA